jgi:outer membrane protein
MRAAALLLLTTLAGPVASATTAPQDAAREAAPPSSLRLTVEQAVARALSASPRLARLSDLEAASEAQQREARAGRLPQLDLTAGYQRRSDVPELSIFAPTGTGGQPLQRITVFPNIPDNWRVRAGVELPLYTGGRLAGQIEAADQGRSAAAQDLRAARADLVLETKGAYWSLVTSRERQRVLQEAIKAYDAHLHDAQSRERFGMAARNEVLAVQVERDRAELEKLSAQAGAELAEANLQRLLDLPAGTSVETGEALAAPTQPAGGDLAALVARAVAARPERQALAARAAAAEAAAHVERGARLPQLALSGGYTYANPNRDIVPPSARWRDTWDVALGLSWSVFDGGRRSAGEAQARARSAAAREQLRELDRAIRLEVTQRALELRTAEARVTLAARSVESAAESRRVAGDRYREGVIPSSELLDAEVAHERAALLQTEALADLRLAQAGLDRAVGR